MPSTSALSKQSPAFVLGVNYFFEWMTIIIPDSLI